MLPSLVTNLAQDLPAIIKNVIQFFFMSGFAQYIKPLENLTFQYLSLLILPEVDCFCGLLLFALARLKSE